EAACVALGKNLKIGSFLSDRADLHFTTFDLWKIGTLKAALGPSYVDKMYLSSASCALGWNKNGWDYQAEATGEWKGPFTAYSQGKLDFSRSHFFLVCETLE